MNDAARVYDIDKYREGSGDTPRGDVKGEWVDTHTVLSYNYGQFISADDGSAWVSAGPDPRIDFLVGEVAELKTMVAKLAEKIEDDGPVIEIRDITYRQAKKEIRQFFKDNHGEDYDACDLEDLLGIDFDTALRACEALEKEGKIKDA